MKKKAKEPVMGQYVGGGQYIGGMPEYWFPDERGGDEGYLKVKFGYETFYVRARNRPPVKLERGN